MEFFHSKGTFSNSEFFHTEGIFLQSTNFTTIKELFYNQGTFPQSRNFSIKKFYLIKDIFYKQGSFPQIFFLVQESSPQAKIFTQSKNFSASKDQKGSLRVKVLDPFTIKSFVKNLFNPSMLVGNKRT